MKHICMGNISEVIGGGTGGGGVAPCPFKRQISTLTLRALHVKNKVKSRRCPPTWSEAFRRQWRRWNGNFANETICRSPVHLFTSMPSTAISDMAELPVAGAQDRPKLRCRRDLLFYTLQYLVQWYVSKTRVVC